MKIQVEYTAQLRLRAQCDGETLDLPEGADTATLVRAVVDRLGNEVAALLLDADGTPAPTVLCFVDDSQTEWGQVLAEGDTVTLMTPISGG
jgi:molybdopterin converting factor small subunit